MKSERTRAIVLRRTNYGEADRILQLITPLGRRAVMARGVRREKSRLAGSIELFSVSDVVIGSGKGNLGILTSTRLVHFYRHILEDYERMQFAYRAVQLVAKASESIDEPEWYDILLEVLMALDSKSVAVELTQSWFYLHHSALLGYELSLQRDSGGELITESGTYRYDSAEQSLRLAQSGELDARHIKLLRLMMKKDLRTLAQIGGIGDIIGICEQTAREHASL